jgi:hypothetical protein
MHIKNEEKRIKKKKNSRTVNVICVPKLIPMPLPLISVKKMLQFVICWFKILFRCIRRMYRSFWPLVLEQTVILPAM